MPETLLDEPPSAVALTPEFRAAILSGHEVLWNAVHSDDEAMSLLVAKSWKRGEELWVLAHAKDAPTVFIRVYLGNSASAIRCAYAKATLCSDPEPSEGFARRLLGDLDQKMAWRLL